MAEERKAAPEQQKDAAPAKKKPPVKTIGLIAGIMVAEAAGVYMLIGMTSPKPVVAETELHGQDEAAAKETVEIELIDDKFQNMQTGRVWLWDMRIVLKTARKNEEHINEQLEKRASEIQEGIAQIVRRAQHSHLKEPDLVTISRQISAYADKVFGHDAKGNSRVERILIPKCRGVDVER
ncbi:MAG: hypothetical protein KF678_09325 [Phycisphaeraceae bacterium]|nr:hypothetical protein [Phycisphaeraceae bacterium]